MKLSRRATIGITVVGSALLAALIWAPARRQWPVPVEPEFLASGFSISSTSQIDQREFAKLVSTFRAAKLAHRDFDRVKSVSLDSPSKAVARFTWDGGAREGIFTLEKKDGAWRIVGEKHVM